MKQVYLHFLLLTICSFSVSVNAQENIGYTWSNVLSNDAPLGGAVIPNSIKTDAAGNSYVIGYFQNAADFDPGAGTVNLVSKGNSDVFFAKYDPSGNYIYAKSIGSTGYDYGYGIEIDAGGNVYITGSFEGTVDFDPGNGVTSLSSISGVDLFFAKYDAAGNYIFAKGIGGSGSEYGYNVAVDGTGNVYVAGAFQTTVDFDPGAGTANLTSTGGDNSFFAKYDPSGNYLYANRLGAASSTIISNQMVVDAGGNVYITGNFSSTIDFDAGAGTANLTSAGSTDIYFTKYDGSGNYVFAHRIGGTAGDQGMRLTVDASGNIYLTGMFSLTADFDPGASTANLTSAGGIDVFFAKYNSSGNYISATRIGGTGGELVFGIATDAAGNVHLTGSYTATADFDPGAAVANLTSTGSNEIYIAKYDASGNYLYAKSVGGPQVDRGNGIALDASGNVYSTGFFRQTADFNPGAGTSNFTAPSGLENGYVLSLDNAGNYRNASIFGGYSSSSLGDYGREMAVDGSGNVYITGVFSGTVDFNPGAGTANLTSVGSSDVYFAKYDPSGNYVYAKQLGGPSFDNLYDVAVDATGNVFITGSFQGTVDFDPGAGTANLTSAGSDDVFLAKYNSAGEYVYAKRIGGTGTDAAESVVVDATGNAYITGLFIGTVDFDPGAGTANITSVSGSFDIFFAKYDASGNYVYAKSIGSPDTESTKSIALDGSGNVYISGNFYGTLDIDPGAGTANVVSAGAADIFFAKYDASGNYVFAKSIGGTGDDNGSSLQVDASGNIYVTGYFNGSADFDPGAGTVNLLSAGESDIFIAKYDATGSYVYANRMGSTTYDLSSGVAVDANGNAYITGYFVGTADFDPSTNTANLTSNANGRDIFFAKYDAAGNYVYAKQVGGNSEDITYDIAVDASGNVLLNGYVTGTVDVDPSATIISKTALNSFDIYFAKFSVCSVPELTTLSTSASPANVTAATSLTDGGCRLLATVEPNGASPVSGTVNAQLWIESSVPTYAGQPFVARHYEITPAVNASSATGRVTLYFTQQEFTDFNNHPASTLDLPTAAADAAGIANLRIGKYNGSSNNGTGLPGSYTTGASVIDPDDVAIVWNATLSRWEVSIDVNGFSGFIVQTTATTLPVSLTQFTAQKNAEQVLLKWTTANEQDNKGFAVERSNNGSNFSSIGYVQAKGNGNSTTIQEYSFTDANPLPGRNFYRLQQQDVNGTIAYSMVRQINFNKSFAVVLYPNPVGNTLMIDLQNTQPALLQINLTDLQGRSIKNWSYKNVSGLLQLNLNGVGAGYYQLELFNDKGDKEVHRLLKQ